MLKQTVFVAAAATLLTVAVSAQSLSTAAARPGTAGAEQAATPATPAPAQRPVEPAGQSINVGIELTISETGAAGPTRKTVSMIVADRQNGSVRSNGRVTTGRNVAINVDAKPTILRDGALKLDLSLEYQPRAGTEVATPAVSTGLAIPVGADAGVSNLNQRIGVILESGKPLVISQAADAGSDRQITVTVKATILK